MTSVEQEEQERGRALETARDALVRRRWLAGLTLAGGVVTVLSVVFFLPDVYRSSATVLIDRQQIPDDLVRSTVTSDLEIRLHTISQEILSRSRLEALIERFSLYPELRENAPVEEVVERMREDVNLQLLKGTDRGGDRGGRGTVAFRISYLGSDAQKAALVANTLASFYIEENLKVRERQAAGTAEFLRVQLEDAKRRLEQQEQQVGRFKEQHIGALPQQMEANLATLEQLNNQLRVNSESQIMVSERRAALQKQVDELEGAGAPGGPRHTAERLATLNAELTQLRTRYSEKYPDVIRLKREIAELEEQWRKGVQAQAGSKRPLPANPQLVELRTALGDLDARARALQAEGTTLQRALARYQQRVENVPRTEQEYQKLARDYETTKELYRSLKGRYEEALLGESMETQHRGEMFRIVEPALPPDAPTAPRTARLALLGLMAALGVAAVAVMVAEQVDTSFHSVTDLRAHLGVPVAVAIPQIVTATDERRRRRRTHLMIALSLAGLVIIVALSWLIASGNYDLVSLLARRS
jgi:polysaccharide chain length determinant protein (PEP-CTERM system associated)